MRVDHVEVDFMGIDLMAPNPCFVKYVHHSQNPPAQQNSGACMAKRFQAPHFVTVVSWGVGWYVTRTSRTKCTSDLRWHTRRLIQD